MSFNSIGESKKEVERLCLKLKQFRDAGQIRRLSEEETKKTFITPLFRALGWDVENDHSLDEVINEERVSKGRVDYSFRINGIPKFFLEAKALNKGLDESKDAGQAINYAWHKGTSWAVLTDFQTLIIYNAEVKDNNLSNSRFKYLTFDQFSDHFDELWLLSKQSFGEGQLDKAASSWGKKLNRTKVGDQLLSELMYYRTLLSKSIVKNNASKNLTQEDIDEAVQRIIDRLIFIRTTEDRNIEPPTLEPLVREFSEKKRGKVTAALNEIYRRFDEAYNSKLFTFNAMDLSQRHLCETLEIENEILLQVMNGLYHSRDGLTHYDFSAIDADVLGNIYEQYLSHILKKTDKRAKVESKAAHRKEQGIYYTPTYIVDYIVRNTLGELIKKKKPEEVDKIKVLDMACGSGSFLLKSFDVLDEYYKKRDKNYAQSKLDTKSEANQITRRTQILKNNIYGVDLDPKAVEIAQLNLLLKAAETKHRLPDLHENVKCGNSLIDQALTEETRAFDWNKEFAGIMSAGGFDIVIGNPPYIKIQNIDESQKEFFVKQKNASGKFDVYLLFLEKSYDLLKDNGLGGFITPSNYLKAQYGKSVRKLLAENTTIRIFVDFGDLKVFSDATTYPSILIFEKAKPKLKHKVRYVKVKTLENQSISEIVTAIKTDIKTDFIESYDVPQTSLSEQYWSLENQVSHTILEKIRAGKKTNLGELSERIFTGIQTSADKEYVVGSKDPRYNGIDRSILKPYLFGKDVRRWAIRFKEHYLIYPHKKSGGKVIAISPEEMKSNYPKTWSYLTQSEIKRKLQSREYLMENIKSGSREQWYEVWCQRDPDWFSAPKILTPALSDKPNFVFDNKGYYFVSGSAGVYGIMLKPKYATPRFYNFLLAILNSKLVDFFIKSISPMFSGGYYKYNTQYLEPIPIIIPDEFQISKLANQSEMLEKITVEIERNPTATDSRLRLETQAKEIQQNIDIQVFELYGLTSVEQRIVEAAVK